MNKSPYWLYGWIENHNISDIASLNEVLKKNNIFDELTEVASIWSENTQHYKNEGDALMAGSGLDFISKLSCHSTYCRLLQVDTLFRHAWHYFDKIYLPDFVGEAILCYKNEDKSKLFNELLSLITVVLKIIEIDACSLIEFYPKTKIFNSIPETDNYSKQEYKKIQKTFYGILEKDLRYKFVKRKDHFLILYSHPLLENDSIYNRSIHFVDTKIPNVNKRKEFLFYNLLNFFMNDLVFDSILAKKFNSPLGSTVPIHGKVMSELDRGNSLNDIAFNLDFPIINNVPIEILLKLRKDNIDSFKTFRQSIRDALLLFKNNYELNNISQEIESDIIKPTLLQLNNKLFKAKNAYNKKRKIAMSIGAITTVCGLFSGLGIDISTSAGIATSMGLLGQSRMKLVDDTKEIEESKYFFLWKALHYVKNNNNAI